MKIREYEFRVVNGRRVWIEVEGWEWPLELFRPMKLIKVDVVREREGEACPERREG